MVVAGGIRNMSLGIYDENKLPIADFGNRIVTSHNGTLGESVDALIYLRNDDQQVYYTGISVQINDSTSPDDTLGPEGTGWGVRLFQGAREPTPAEWDSVTFDNIIVMPDVGSTLGGNTNTYEPFWVRVTIPGGTVSLIKEEMSLLVAGTERLIGT